jgi:hypothetical protein
MTKIDRLKKEARESAMQRDHTMTQFERVESAVLYYSECKKCYAGVWVEPNPPPNGIEIAGPAVALNCKA